MARQKKQQPPPPGAPLWLATYGDMVTLILTFFILLFSFSSIDVQKFEKMIQSFKGALGIMPGGTTVQRNPGSFGGLTGKDAGESKKSTTSVEEVAKNLKNYLKSQGLDKGVEVRIDQKGVTISFSEHVLFDSGSAEMKPEGKRVLTKVAEFIREAVPALSVEGHTDSIPLRGGIYRDNWGLSASRAASVATYLQDRAGFDPQKLQAVGYASTRPIVPNDTPEHMALNRRVDLVILSSFPKR